MTEFKTSTIRMQNYRISSNWLGIWLSGIFLNAWYLFTKYKKCRSQLWNLNHIYHYYFPAKPFSDLHIYICVYLRIYSEFIFWRTFIQNLCSPEIKLWRFGNINYLHSDWFCSSYFSALNEWMALIIIQLIILCDVKSRKCRSRSGQVTESHRLRVLISCHWPHKE